jgi:nucleotide-binding universal stress UspA family protein
MFARTILHPTDFSQASDAALKVAGALARETGAKLLIAHVHEPSPACGAAELCYGPAEHDSPFTPMLAEVIPADAQVRYEHAMLSGDPATEIVSLAKRRNVDLIVMGTHGQTGLRRALMGSVAEAVVRRAECPVLTLKAPQPVTVNRAAANPIGAELCGRLASAG